MQIAIIGTGNVGSALGDHWTDKGHDVIYGVRDPGDSSKELPRNAVSIREAAQKAEVIVLAVPWNAVSDVVADAGSLDGKVLIDCTNPLKPGLTGLAVGLDTSAAEQLQNQAPGASVFKALNQTGAENMASVTGYKSAPVMFVCGNNEAAKLVVMELVRDLGFEAVDAGDLTAARVLEPLAMLWIRLAYKQNLGRDFAFGILRR
jgi:predicted dinucleotide-binding enzyme